MPPAPNSKHRPISPASARLMAVCEAKRVADGLSYGALAREILVDKADLCRALKLKEEPSARTRGALVSYFGLADAAALTARERESVLLMQAGAAARQTADSLEAIIKLRVACDPPEV